LVLAAVWQVNGRAFDPVFGSFEDVYNCQATTIWEYDHVATNWCDCQGEPDFCNPNVAPSTEALRASGWTDITVELPTTGLALGQYLLTFETTLHRTRAGREVRFTMR
jgi:hypothetical protein